VTHSRSFVTNLKQGIFLTTVAVLATGGGLLLSSLYYRPYMKSLADAWLSHNERPVIWWLHQFFDTSFVFLFGFALVWLVFFAFRHTKKISKG
jgi:hypothetical protein